MNKSREDSSRSASARPASPGEALGRELSTAVIAFHEAVAARLGMSATEWRCLGLLGQHGPSTAGRLAELSGFTTGAITGIVDRLERAGHVRREPNPRDRRGVIIHAIPNLALQNQVVPIFASLGQAMATLSSHYSAEELAAIQDYFERTIRVLRDEAAKLIQSRDEESAPSRPP